MARPSWFHVPCIVQFLMMIDVRLIGGPSSNKGTVEIRIDNGTWETTCGVNLGVSDVIVICRQLGFTAPNRAIQDTPYGQYSTPTRGLHCNGGNDIFFKIFENVITLVCLFY